MSSEVTWSVRIASRLSPETTQRICALVGLGDDSRTAAETAGTGQEPTSETSAKDDDGFDMLAFIKSAPGNVSLESMMTKIRKSAAVRAIEPPPGLFASVAPPPGGPGRRWRRPRTCEGAVRPAPSGRLWTFCSNTAPGARASPAMHVNKL
ncbi:hypothetical protein ACSDR0_45620 [Streptosporangium sp. G11]|uniref:hypothetical protein n=1 Tax=Streptosporangium sp. G11 TaxID=3436926 RepID=UPI003EBAABA1